MAQHPIEGLTAVAKDAMYVSVGLGVIAFQRLQVRRNELAHALAAQSDEAREALALVSTMVGEGLKTVEERVGATFERGR